MTNRLTQEDITNRIWEILKPQDQGQPKLVNLLQMMARQQSNGPIPMQPTGQVKQTAASTPENIAASMSTPPNPKTPDYPFIRRR